MWFGATAGAISRSIEIGAAARGSHHHAISTKGSISPKNGPHTPVSASPNTKRALGASRNLGMMAIWPWWLG